MRASEFRRSVRAKAGVTPRWAVDAAADYFIGEDRNDRRAVAPCLELAERFAVSHADAAHLPADPGLLLTTEQLVDAITPDVERVRREVFGKEAPPFPSLADGARWIEKEARVGPQASERARAKARGLMREAARLAAEAAGLLHVWADGPGLRVVTLTYAKPDAEWVSRVPTSPGSHLARLAESAQALAKATGFAEEAVVAYMLVGVRPVLPVARITEHMRSTRGLGTLTWATVELHSGGIAPRQFLALYDQVRTFLGVAPYSKPLTAQHQALLETVKRLGGEPPAGGGRAAFWERVRAAMNREQQPRKYDTWRGPEMRYRRLVKRLGGGA